MLVFFLPGQSRIPDFLSIARSSESLGAEVERDGAAHVVGHFLDFEDGVEGAVGEGG